MTKMKNNRMLIGCACAAGCETLFGMGFMFTKQGLDCASTLALLGWRFVVAFVVMTLGILLGVIKINLKAKGIKPLIKIAFFSPVLYFIGETIGIGCTTGSESGVFLATIPIFSILASTLILHKKPTRIQVIGILVTLAGVLITVLALGAAASLSVLGYACLLGAVIMNALYAVFVEQAEAYTGIEITYVMMTGGAVVFGILALVEGAFAGNLAELACLPFVNMSFLGSILYLGIACSIMAYFLSNAAIARIGVNAASTFIGLSTVVSIISGVLVRHEAFSVYQLVGAVIILAGVYIANSKNKAAESQVSSPESIG